MSPYWVCVVSRGGVETRNPVFMKMSQTRSSQMSFFLLHKTEFCQLLRCTEVGEGVWPSSRREVGFTCVSPAACRWTALQCRQPRDGHVVFVFIITFTIFGVGRIGVSRNHLYAEVPVSRTSGFVAAFNTCHFLREEGSETSPFCGALRLWRAGLVVTGAVSPSCISPTHHTHLLQPLCCNRRGFGHRLPCGTQRPACRPVPAWEKDV